MPLVGQTDAQRAEGRADDGLSRYADRVLPGY
jgi:hypothetical protein